MRVGPAGWAYPDWEGRVYPDYKAPGFHPLTMLARLFDCIEINSTFYALPRPDHATRWAELVQANPELVFTAKLYRDFTHVDGQTFEQRLPQLEQAARSFLSGLEPLRSARRLRAVLVQFSAGFLHGKSEVRRLGRIRSWLDGLPLVVELRHESWFQPPALASLRGLGYSLAYLDLPPAWNHPPAWHEPTGRIGYLRLHGRNEQEWFRPEAGRDQRYNYLYRRPELTAIAERARRIEQGHEESMLVTNNHFAGKAVANALELLYLLRGEQQPVPAELLEAYPRLATIAKEGGQGGLFR
jgi:uncharacterized protein YecE (DUF72 family)